MRPDQFLTLADALLQQFPIPSGYRSAVSRAYYAAHHHIKEFIESAGVSVKGGMEAHADVWNHLANIGDSGLEQVGSELSALRGDRNDADYKLLDPRLEKSAAAKSLVDLARSLMNDVDQCRRDTGRYAQVCEAIRARHKELRGL